MAGCGGGSSGGSQQPPPEPPGRVLDGFVLLQIDLSDPTERITAQRFICGSNCIPAPGEPPLVLFDNADAPTRGPVVVPSFPEGDYRFVVGTVSGGCEIQVLVLEQNAGDEDVIRFQLCPAGG